MKVELDPADVPVFRGGGRVVLGSVVAAAIGLVLVVAGWLLAPERTAHAWLAAFITCASTSVGGLVFLAIVHAMNAKWPVVVRRLIEAVVAPLPVLAIAFIPIAVFADDLYPWVAPVSHDLPHHVVELIAKKKPWFELEFFWIRSAFYLTSWIVVAGLLLRWSARQDRDRTDVPKIRQRMLSAAALPLIALTLTFASFDWVMSLDPAWYSTIFGIYVFAGGFVAALGVLTIATTLAQRGGWLAGLVNPSHHYALGRLLLAFVVFWAYIAFFQLMLIWLANRPQEVVWYLERSQRGWQWIALAVVVLHFVVPFFALLSYAIKWRPRALSTVAGVIVLAHWIEIHWIVVPAGRFEWIAHWVDLGAMLLIGGSCVAFAMWRMRGRPIAPRYDAALSKGARYYSV
jgi:hypothetical protein